jgi:hypothetical protein
MAIVRCPRCRDELTVPAKATSRALVRCPLCLEEYLLAEALANAPPLLVIIGGEVPQSAIDDSPVAGHDYQLAATALEGSDNPWGQAGTATLAPQVPTIRGRRSRPRQANVFLLLLNWVGGGVLGLALAPLVLWWIFKTDPVELGPTVAAYAPWAVPAQFHGKPVFTDTEIPPPPRPRRTKKAAPVEEPASEQRPAGEELQTLPGLDQVPPPAPIVTPAIDAPELSRPPAEPAPPPTSKPEPQPAETRPEEPRDPPPPMPDLKDLLP